MSPHGFTLVIPFVPVGTLRYQRKTATRDALVKGVRRWLKTDRLSFRDGDSAHCCTMTRIYCNAVFDMTLYMKVIPLPGRVAMAILGTIGLEIVDPLVTIPRRTRYTLRRH